MTERPTPDLVIEPLDLERHDRAAFSCGVEQADNFLKKTAGKLTRADNTRVYVLADPAGAIMGFYAINAHAIDYQDLPKRSRTWITKEAYDRLHSSATHGGNNNSHMWKSYKWSQMNDQPIYGSTWTWTV